MKKITILFLCLSLLLSGYSTAGTLSPSLTSSENNTKQNLTDGVRKINTTSFGIKKVTANSTNEGYQLDSTIEKSSSWFYPEKSEYSYDSYGNLILVVIYYWDTTTKTWKIEHEYTFDSYGNQTLDVYSWNNTTSTWEIGNKHEYTYDSYENKTLDVYYIWNNSNPRTWEVRNKHEYNYDNYGNQILDIYYVENYTNNLVNRDKHEYTYDSNGNKTSDVYYLWIGTLAIG